MLRSGCPVRPDVAFWANAVQQVCFLASPHLSQNISRSRARAITCGCVCAHGGCCLPCGATHLAPRGSPIQRVLPSHANATPPPSLRRAPSPAAPALARCALHPRSSSLRAASPLLRAVSCPPRARGAAEVSQSPSFSTRRSWPLRRYGRRDARPQQQRCCDESACCKCFICFRGMLQLFHMDVAKVVRDVAYVANVSEVLFKMFHLF
jgi:hypothetical protein